MKNEPLTTGKIAEYCHVTYRAVLKWIDEGKLKAYRTPGKHSRVEVADFLNFLKSYNMPVPDELTDLKFKVLIVDDDKKIVDLISKSLQQDNKYTINTAYDGFRAGQRFCRLKPELVILDINMPGIDGYEVCEYIRNNPDNREVKILVVSGMIGTPDGDKIMDMGADDSLAKPFDIDVLKSKVEKLLGIKNNDRGVEKGQGEENE